MAKQSVVRLREILAERKLALAHLKEKPIDLRVLEILVERKLSVNYLAKRAGLTTSTLDAIVNGRHKDPRWSTILKICAALELTPDELHDSIREESLGNPPDSLDTMELTRKNGSVEENTATVSPATGEP